MRAISGTSRPSSSTRAFHVLNVSSSSSSSWPRRSSRTGCPDSGLTRYWYHERSQATVTAISPASPERGTMLARASPRLFAIPPTVRRYVLPLKRSAASRSATSSSERRRRIGSDGVTAASAVARRRPRSSGSPRRRRRRSWPITGVVGVPSLSQPCSRAISWQSGQTSTSSAPSSGAKRTARSPMRRVRSQIAHVRTTPTLVTRMAPTIAPACRASLRRANVILHVCFTPAACVRHGPRSRRRHDGHWRGFSPVERFAEPALLLLLRERPAYGYELLERLPELTGEARVEMGNLYRLLRALEEERLVTSEWSDGKRTYALTEHGGALLDQWAEALRATRERTDRFLQRYEEGR